MKCEKCGAELDENNICPICGANSTEEQIAVDSEQKNLETETEVDIESLENLKVDFDEVDGSETTEQEETEKDDFIVTSDELVIDFDEINNNAKNIVVKKNNSSWMFAFVSFIAGVLATLITIGCFNGTIINYFDKITNGSPKDTVESFCKFYYQTDSTAKKITEIFSPYLREQIVSELKSYTESTGASTDVDFDIDVTNDGDFEKVAEFYLDLITNSSTQKISITKLDFDSIEYYKSGTDEFNSYLSEYKNSENEKVANAEGVSVFAKVSFKINFTIESIPQPTTVTQQKTTANITEKTNKTKKKDSDNKNNTTATTTKPQATTEQTTSSVEEESENGTVICVKVNDKWQIFNGMQTTGSAQ